MQLLQNMQTAKTLLHTSITKFYVNISGDLFTVTINNDIYHW